MKKFLTLLLFSVFVLEGKVNGQNTTCINSQLICTGPTYTYEAGTTGSAEQGAYYACLQTQPAPAWFHMCFETAGSVTIRMLSTPLVDIDFICWGPFLDPFSPCVDELTANKVIDCNYSPNPQEYCEIQDGQPGEYYILLITNYSLQPAYITFEQTSGSGTLACEVIYKPIADFSANPLEGYAPLNVQFTDQSTQNPTIWNWDFQNDGVFDAFVQNPSFIYYQPGNYTVMLVAANASAADTLVKENYVTVDQDTTGDGLVADYPFNGDATDISGHENHGTVYGATLTNDRFGYPEAAYHFNGTYQHIEVVPSLTLNTGEMNSFSVSLWGKLNAVNDEDTYMNVNNKTDGNDFDIRPQDGKITFINHGGSLMLQDDQEVTVNEWYHIVVVLDYSIDSAYLYVNGQLVAADSAEIVRPYSPYFSFGRHTLNSWYFNGVLDDIKIYNRVLSAEEIDELYTINSITMPEICVVTVTPDEHSQVIWNNQFSTCIDFYNIFRETSQENIYEQIGTVPYGSQGIFTDTTSNPEQRPYKYRMTATLDDSTETDTSVSHQTIHLTISQEPEGWNLVWSPYDGISFNSYYIYRGTSSDSLVVLDSISSSFTSFTDFDPPWGPLYYAVEIINEEGCFPVMDNDNNRSHSNIVFNGMTGISEISDTGISIYPNPCSEVLSVKVLGLSSGICYELVIYNLQGVPVISTLLNSSDTRVNIKDISPGVYFIRVNGGDSGFVRKLVKF